MVSIPSQCHERVLVTTGTHFVVIKAIVVTPSSDNSSNAHNTRTYLISGTAFVGATDGCL